MARSLYDEPCTIQKFIYDDDAHMYKFEWDLACLDEGVEGTETDLGKREAERRAEDYSGECEPAQT